MKMARKTRSRRGAAAVETALMLPLLVITSFGAIDVAQYINSAQTVSNSCREAARIAIRNQTTTTQEVEDKAMEFFADSFPQLSQEELEESVEITIQNFGQGSSQSLSGAMTSIESGETLLITVVFDYEAIRWIPGVRVFSNLSTETFCRRD